MDFGPGRPTCFGATVYATPETPVMVSRGHAQQGGQVLQEEVTGAAQEPCLNSQQ